MKRQNHHRKKFIWGKTLFSAVLTAVLLVNLWAAFPSVSQASGTLKWTENEENVWGPEIKLQGYKAEQKVTTDQIRIDGTAYTLSGSPAEGRETYQIDLLYREKSKMTIANLNPSVEYTKGTLVYKENGGTESGYYVSPKSGSTKTYYKVITDENDAYAFEDFESTVRKKFKKSYPGSGISEKMLATNKEGSPAGYAFDGSVTAYMNEKQAAVYESSSKIPLKDVKRIDMITMTYIDHFMRVKIGEDYLSHDYDEVVYHCYSYEFAGPKAQLAAPVLRLESGADVSEGKAASVFADDSIVGIEPVNPDPSDVNLTNGYEKIKSQITYKYYFSNSKLSSFANVKWNVWNAEDIPLNSRKYLYVKAIAPTEEQTGSGYRFTDSEPACYEWNYRTDKPGSVTGEAIDVIIREDSSSSEPDSLKLSETGGAGIYYTLNGEPPIGGKVSKEQREKLEKFAQGEASGTIVSLEDKKYVKINHLWYECNEQTEKYDDKKSVALEYGEDQKAKVTVQAASDGKVIGEKQDLIYQKLTPPDVYLEDGQTRLDNNTSIAAEDRVILKAEGQKTGNGSII